MKEIILLESVHGYVFGLDNEEITYVHVNDQSPVEGVVRPLFQAIKKNREQAVEYLKKRSQSLNIGEHLWNSAERAQTSARHAESIRNDVLAQKEWQRSVRLFAASAKAFGATEPHIPWEEWIAGYAAKKEFQNGDKEKV